jgi:hypothetical protein
MRGYDIIEVVAREVCSVIRDGVSKIMVDAI